MSDRALREAMRKCDLAPDDQELLARALQAHQRAGLAPPARLALRQRFPGLSFASTVPMDVWVERESGGVSRLGTTGTKAGLRIPRHRSWWVANPSHSGLAVLSPRFADEVIARGVPGVVLADVDERAAGRILAQLEQAAPSLIGFQREYGSVGTRELGLAARFADLRRLRLRGSRWDDSEASARAAAALAGLRSLLVVHLEMKHFGIGPSSVALRCLPPTVAVLVAPCAQGTDGGWSHVAGLRELVTLDASGSGLDGEHLARIAGECPLEELSVGGPALDDLAPLAAARGLRRLVLDGTPARRAWLRPIASLPVLESLSLARCAGLDDATLKQVAKLSTLRQLTIDHCPDVTASGIGGLKALPLLEQLFVRGNKSSAEARRAGAERLKKALPGCSVHV